MSDGRASRSRAILGVVGAGLLAAHIVLFPVVMERCDRDPLRVVTSAPPAAPTLSVDAELPPGLAERTTMLVDNRPYRPDMADDVDTGMHRVSWRVAYRGGFEREVGMTQLVGPVQGADAPRCSIRLIVGQRLLDGRGSRGRDQRYLARLLASRLEHELAGLDEWPLNRFLRVEGVEMRWVIFSDIGHERRRARLRKRLGDPPGVLLTWLDLVFEDGTVPLWVGIAPEVTADSLILRTHVEAELDLDSRVYQWIADLFDGDDIASQTARRELDSSLISAFGLPPPLTLEDGSELRFAYCPGQPIEVVTDRYAAIPIQLVRASGGDIQPVLLGGVARRGPLWGPGDDVAPLAIEFELDAINALLHELWRVGYLDREFARTGVVDGFNNAELVRELLSVRIRDARLSLPPTVWPGRAPDEPAFQLGVELGIAIHDGGVATPAHMFGVVGFEFTEDIEFALTLSDLALTCRPAPDVLVPCYSNLVSAFRDRAGDVHGVLSRKFTDLFRDIAVDRTIDVSEARFAIQRAGVRSTRVGRNAIVRVDLFGELSGLTE